jgi:hypothetical protein
MTDSDNVVDLPSRTIQVRSIDELRDTHITIGCYRETERLGRVLDTFQKALTLARRDGRDADLLGQLVSLHDHKGDLTAKWRDLTLAQSLFRYVNAAWEDQCECNVQHEGAL